MSELAAAWPMILKLLLAGVLGGIVGYEREVHERPAGLRTHILVCMGSALITLVSVSFVPPVGDPGRIAAQIVSGIGFLGAGTILRQGNIVRGLTTAASLWTVAGIGMAVAIGGIYSLLAVVATGVVFLTLGVMSRFEPALGKRLVQDIRLRIPAGKPEVLPELLQKLTSLGVAIQVIRGLEIGPGEERCFQLKISVRRSVKPESIVRILAEQPDLTHFELS